MNTCSACQHFSKGECFRYPPTQCMYPTDNQHPIMYECASTLPQVSEDMRACGEFEMKEEFQL